MMSSLLAVISLFALLVHSSTSSTSMSMMDLPANMEWTSLSEKVQYMPASDEDSPLLRQVQHRFLSYYSDHFVDGQETQYNEYAQAWRLLGLYVDCDTNVQEGRRRLEEDVAEDEEGDDANNNVADEDEGEAEEVVDEENDGGSCVRRLLWAAYVDLDYEGNGLSEYKIFNTEFNFWDSSACKTSDGKRCVKMDCHLSGSNFKALGYFMEEAPIDFLTLLAAHQGTCTWNDELSDAMDDGIEWIPQECTQTDVVIHNADGTATYAKFDLKPLQGGGVDVALYTDYDCLQEYTGKEVTVDEVLESHLGFDVEREITMKYFNAALDSFKVCTPCRTYDFSSVVSHNNDNADDEEANDGSDPNNSNFVCLDSAGYYGVNMCMMFAQNSQKASFREVTVASQQGTISRTYASVDVSESWWQAWGFFFMSLLVFVLGMICFCSVAVKRKRISSDSNEPLLRQ